MSKQKIDEFKKELKLLNMQDDECCIIFDFGCYFPYANSEVLNFGFSLGEEQLEPVKINHRYPNKGYQTITRKYGKQLSKVGYPYIIKLDEQHPMLLCIKVGLKDQHVNIVLPVHTNMTKDKPFCILKLHYNFDKNRFEFISYDKCDGGWTQYYWYSHDTDNACKNDIILNPPKRIDNILTVIYDDVITPYPLALNDLIL